MKIGVLALQGAFIEHIRILKRLGADTKQVRRPEQLRVLDGLILPGGESTTIAQLAHDYGLVEPLRRFALQKPVWGTCAGMILMAKRVVGGRSLLETIDIDVERNAFGPQIDSFKADLDIPVLNTFAHRLFPAVFIRAPKIVAVHGKAKVIARLKDGTPVAAREEKRLVTAFHPELTGDDRLHRYFLTLARKE